MIKIGAIGTGLAAILGAGAIVLAALGNAYWLTFLAAAIVVFLLPLMFKFAERLT